MVRERLVTCRQGALTRTDCRGPFFLQDINAFDNCGTGVVDAIKHCLGRVSVNGIAFFSPYSLHL